MKAAGPGVQSHHNKIRRAYVTAIGIFVFNVMRPIAHKTSDTYLSEQPPQRLLIFLSFIRRLFESGICSRAAFIQRDIGVTHSIILLYLFSSCAFFTITLSFYLCSTNKTIEYSYCPLLDFYVNFPFDPPSVQSRNTLCISQYW